MTETPPLDFYDVKISVPWGQIAGRWYGNREVRPILAVHGWQDNFGTWDRLLPLLPHHIGVLCIDLPGHGLSSRYPKGMTYHTLDHAYVIKRVVAEYNWSKVSLMGHSMGGVACCLYAALNPKTVDMLIQLDIILSENKSDDFTIQEMALRADRLTIEDERMEQLDKFEPPSFKYHQLEEILHRGLGKSVDKNNCKHILNRNIVRSPKYPEKFYFCRDGKLKYNVRFVADKAVYLELAKRISHLNHLVIRANRSDIFTENSFYLVDLLREKNSNFEMHTIDGTHHVHLNSPTRVAKIMTPFILKHRPVRKINKKSKL